MQDSYQWLPVLCRQILDGRFGSGGLSRVLERSRAEVTMLESSRKQEFQRWERLRLRRQHMKQLQEMHDWGMAELSDINLALDHLNNFRISGDIAEVQRAKARLQMADQAAIQYLKRRVVLEPILVDLAIADMAA